MTQTTVAESPRAWDFRLAPKDVGVAIVVVVALLLGAALRGYTEGRSATFQDKSSPFAVTYPATWGTVETLRGLVVKLEDPSTDSAFKTSLAVERRGLDAQNPPTLQALVDRRVQQQGALTAYHLLSTAETTVGGAKAMRQEYAYVVQPIDQARRASLPVVAHAIEYVVLAKDNAYFITFSVPEGSFDATKPAIDRIVGSVKVQ